MEHKKSKNGPVEKLLDFSKIIAIVKKNWMVLSQDPVRLVMMFMFPMVMIIIFGYTAGEVPKHVAAGVVNYDNGIYSQELLSQLYSSDIFSLKKALSSQDEGKRLIEQGQIKILFIIPPGFSEDIAAGRSAELSVIVDEADPTIAQINKASTSAFVQALSQKITSERIASLGTGASSVQEQISAAQKTLTPAMQDGAQEKMSLIESEFRSASELSSNTASTLSSSITSLRNSLGFLIDQNEIASAYSPGPGFSGSLAALAAGDTQQATLQQIGIYSGLAISNSKIGASMAKIYSAAEQNDALAAQKKAAVFATYTQLEGAKSSLGEIAAEAGQSSSSMQPIRMNEIDPYGSGRPGLDFLIPNILALIIFQGAVMGLGRAVAGERKDGSLTRVFLTPTSNVTIITGTLLFYLVFEAIRSSIIVFIAILLFGVSISGSLIDILFIIFIYAAGATGLGMIMSVIAKSQEQYMSIAMIATLPTIFLSGVFLPVETMPPVFQGIANAIPVTYAADALRGVMIKGFGVLGVIPDLAFLVLFALGTIVMSVALFKRELL
ncbi:MAG: ABC transporter permease [Candidatus Micrarchaeota archaeon]